MRKRSTHAAALANCITRDAPAEARTTSGLRALYGAGSRARSPGEWPAGHDLVKKTRSRILSALGGEAVADGEEGGLGAVLQAELTQDVGDVALHRAFADHQGTRDLLVASAFGGQAQHLALAIGQLGAGFGFARG